MIKKQFYFIPLMSILSVIGCNKNTTFKCIEDSKFGGIYIDTSISNFDSIFTYGDSLKIEFSNGKSINDIPYYNGYYGKQNDLVVVSYPHSSNPGIHRCQGDSTYKEFNISTNTTLKVTLNQKGKYKDIQDTLNLEYSNDIKEYKDDKVRFANFYALKSSKLKDNLFYRSCSPCNNKYNRAKYASELLEENKIKHSINLSDTEEGYNVFTKQEGFLERSKYYNSLKINNEIDFLDTGMNFKTDEYASKLATVIDEVIDRFIIEGEYHLEKCHFHCDEGKDRTGFVSTLILSLVNSSIEEINEDYMKTYYNYYGIDKTSDEKKYNLIVNLKVKDFLDYFKELSGKEENYIQEGAKKYLIKGGLSIEKVEKIITTISK